MAQYKNQKKRMGSRYKRKSSTTTRQRQWPKGRYTNLRKAARSYVPRLVSNPFPKTKICRHRYTETVTLPAGTTVGLTNQYVFRANGIFDPNLTGAGHQPLFRDAYADTYQHYSVLNSYITVTFSQSTTAQKYYGLYLQDSSNKLQDDPRLISEQFGIRGPLNASQRNAPYRLKKSFNAVKEMRTSSVKALMSDDAYKTAVGSDPGSTKVTRYFIVVHGPQLATETVAAETITVTITYVVAWQDPIDRAALD